MKFLKKVFDFYIESSIHVAFSVYCLVQISYFVFEIPFDASVVNFSFFGTIVGYNFVKYAAFFSFPKKPIRNKLKAILALSLFSLIAVVFCFFKLQMQTQMIALAVLFLTLLYSLPFFPNHKNARNWAGVKIYIVSFCWVGVTLVLPVLNAGLALNFDFYIHFLQRFIIVFILILIFEIIDLEQDDPLLQTVPQQIGVRQTKNLGYFLMAVYGFLGFFNFNFNFNVNNNFDFETKLLSMVIVITIVTFLAFANEKRSKYYTSFWVESLPIFWWLMLVIL